MYELIKTRFGKAVQHYDTHAVAQKKISDTLFSLISGENGGRINGNILEIGCGTGNLSSQLLTLHPEKLVLNDICPEYAPVLAQKLTCELTVLPLGKSPLRSGNMPGKVLFACGNAGELAENLKKSGSSPTQASPYPFRLIASASAVQWLENPLEFIIGCKHIMEPDALLAISTFTPENLYQVSSITGCTLDYPSPEQIRTALEPHYTLLHLSVEEITLSFDEPAEVLRHLKLTGVNGIRSGRWIKKDLEHFITQYELYKTPEGTYPLTYKPIFILCRNKPINH